MPSAITLVQLVGGLGLVLATLTDAIGTLVAARGLTGRWRPTRQFYVTSWRLWSAIGRRMGRRREGFLSVYAPLTLLILLGMWLAGLLVGWALVNMAGNASLEGDTGFGSLLYYSGTCLLTLGFGDILAQTTPLRIVALAEAATGVATMALAISYLPALYAAYGRRESQLLTLDDPSGERIQPTALIPCGRRGATPSACTGSSATGRTGRPTSSRATSPIPCWPCSGHSTGASRGSPPLGWCSTPPW